VEPREFNAVMQGIDYPMFVVTTTDGRERAGCMVGFTTQTSIHPPRMLVCLSVKNRTHRVAMAADLLAVHVLEPDEGPLADLFGGETGDEVDKFERVAWTEGPGGVPLVDECPRRFVGRILGTYDLGDHTGFLLDPLEAEGDASGPALGFQQVKDDVDPGHPA
jgi:flavin reductase (DIM6/NTAB) family NADH-FMN oxidoreductase RutF